VGVPRLRGLGRTEAFTGLEVDDPMVIERPHALGGDVQDSDDLSQVLALGKEGKDGGGFFA
jgi:hypothetical protein